MKVKTKKLKVNLDNLPKETNASELVAVHVDSKSRTSRVVPISDGIIDVTELPIGHNRGLFLIPKELLPSDKKMTAEILKRRGALSITSDLIRMGSIATIPESIIDLWRRQCVYVQGQVRTRCVRSDGSVEYCPVAGARVHICDVDRFPRLLQEVPLEILDRLRVDLLRARTLPQPVGPGPMHHMRAESISGGRPLEKFKLPSSFKSNLRLLGGDGLRRYLVDNYRVIHPYLCLWPYYWRYFYRCDELRTVVTDENGNFSALVCNGWIDQPDVYIWVEYPTDTGWQTIYKPSIPCSVRWNYEGNSDITITVNHPSVPCGCIESVGTQSIGVFYIGNSLISKIVQKNPAPSDSMGNLSSIDTTGLLSANGLFRPYGGRLHFRTVFGSGFPTSGAKYFRWSRRRVGDTGDFTPFLEPLSRAYLVELPTGDFETRYYNLYDETRQLFKITSNEASAFVHVAAGETLYNWVNMVPTSLSWDTGDLSDVFDLRLEIFDQNGNLVNMPSSTYRVVNPLDTDESIEAQGYDSDFIDPAAGNTASAFTMTVRVDNIPCEAEILRTEVIRNNPSNPAVDLVLPANNCGFLDYLPGDRVRIQFKAHHDNKFGAISYHMKKGLNSVPNMGIDPSHNYTGDDLQASGAVPVTYGMNIVSSKQVYTCIVPATELLGGCLSAAYAQVLYISALHTNGYERIRRYDASSTAAFALDETP